MHHADPTGLIRSRRVGMMHECSTDLDLYFGIQFHSNFKVILLLTRKNGNLGNIDKWGPSFGALCDCIWVFSIQMSIAAGRTSWRLRYLRDQPEPRFFFLRFEPKTKDLHWAVAEKWILQVWATSEGGETCPNCIRQHAAVNTGAVLVGLYSRVGFANGAKWIQRGVEQWSGDVIRSIGQAGETGRV